MTEHEKPREPRVFEIERDRFSLMCSRDVEVGECIRVVEVEPVERELSELRLALQRTDVREGEALKRVKMLEREREEMLNLFMDVFVGQPKLICRDRIEYLLGRHGRLSDV